VLKKFFKSRERKEKQRQGYLEDVHVVIKNLYRNFRQY